MCSTDLDDRSHEIRNIIQFFYMNVEVVEVAVFCSLSNYLGTISYGTQREQILDCRVHVEVLEG